MGEARVVTVYISAEVSAVEAMAEGKELLRGDAGCVRFSFNCEANGHRHRRLTM